jgi:hypothetical protein
MGRGTRHIKSIRALLSRRASEAVSSPEPTSPLYTAGVDYPLYRAYVFSLDQKVRIQLDKIIYQQYSVMTGKNCSVCGLPLQMITITAYNDQNYMREFCTVCTYHSPKKDHAILKFKDFDPEDTASQASYLYDLEEKAKLFMQEEKLDFEHKQQLRAFQKTFLEVAPAHRVRGEAWLKLVTGEHVADSNIYSIELYGPNLSIPPESNQSNSSWNSLEERTLLSPLVKHSEAQMQADIDIIKAFQAKASLINEQLEIRRRERQAFTEFQAEIDSDREMDAIIAVNALRNRNANLLHDQLS